MRRTRTIRWMGFVGGILSIVAGTTLLLIGSNRLFQVMGGLHVLIGLHSTLILPRQIQRSQHLQQATLLGSRRALVLLVSSLALAVLSGVFTFYYLGR